MLLGVVKKFKKLLVEILKLNDYWSYTTKSCKNSGNSKFCLILKLIRIKKKTYCLEDKTKKTCSNSKFAEEPAQKLQSSHY